MSAPQSIATLPSNAVLRYENGVLDVLGHNELMRLHIAHEPKAFRKVHRKDWTPFLPAFPVVHPRLFPTPPTPGLPGSAPAQRQMHAAFDAFRADLTDELAQALEVFPGYQWNLLLLVHHRLDALELLQNSPALAWCLANCDQFRPVYNQPPSDWAKWRVGHKQTQILEWLGFPESPSAVRLLRKLTPACIEPSSMRMLRNTLQADTPGAKMMRHQPRINIGVHQLCCHRQLAEVIAPSLVYEAGADPEEDQGSPRADLLADTLDLWKTLHLTGPPPVFGSLRRIQTVHDELLAEYQRRLAVQNQENQRKRRGQFPSPPIPGNEDIIPLCSKSELEKESRDQHNCVGSYYRRILSTGKVFIYKVLRPQRATLSLVRRPDGSWRRGELKAAHNRSVRHATRVAVDHWLFQHEGLY